MAAITDFIEPRILSIAQRIGTIALGVTCMSVTNKLFDLVLYPYVIYQAGLLMGGAIMTVLSAIVCLLFIRFYDRTQQDWLGIETIRDLKDYQADAGIGRFLVWLLRTSDWAAFFLLSMIYDPFITTVWLRHERFGGMTARDHRVFWGSVVVANGFWAIYCWIGVYFLQWLWEQVLV